GRSRQKSTEDKEHNMRLRRAVIALAPLPLVLGVMTAPAHATGQAVENYGSYSRMFSKSAGQYWTGKQVGGQWAWKPTSSTVSEINWGDPKKWPPSYAERFIRRGDWVVLDGWSDNGTYYKLRVSKEQIGDGDCSNMRTFSTSGPQHYVKWTIPKTAYCLKAWGTITEESSGKTIDYSHTQIWYPAAKCSNKYHKNKTCIKQWESWWD